MGEISRSGLTKILLGFLGAVFAALVILALARIGYVMGEKKAKRETRKTQHTSLGGRKIRIPNPKDTLLQATKPTGVPGAVNLTFARDQGTGSREIFYFDIMEAYAESVFTPGDFEAFKEDLLNAMEDAGGLPSDSGAGIATPANLPPGDAEIVRDNDEVFTLKHTKEGEFNGKPMHWYTVVSYALLDGRIFRIEGVSIAPAGVEPADMEKALAMWLKAIQFRNMTDEDY